MNKEMKWLDQSQPQTLQAAVILSYVNAAFALLTLLRFGPGVPFLLLALYVLIPLGQAAAAVGIANDKRLAYRAALALAIAPFALLTYIYVRYSVVVATLLTILFDVVLLVLLVHDRSRKHARVWFR